MGKERWPLFATRPCRQGVNSGPGKDLREGAPDKGKEGLMSILKGGAQTFLEIDFLCQDLLVTVFLLVTKKYTCKHPKVTNNSYFIVLFPLNKNTFYYTVYISNIHIYFQL